MFIFNKGKNGQRCIKSQSLSEYVMLIALVSAALLAMQIYAKRGLQGVIKYASDRIGTQETANIGPYKNVVQNENSSFASNMYGSQNLTVSSGQTRKTINSTSVSSGSSTYNSQEGE